MEDRYSTRQLKRAGLTEASTPTISKRPRPDVLEESPLLLPSSDSLEKIDVPSASGSNSDPSASSTSVNGNNYYVFLSFRGPDTRNGFVDHLYHRLKDVGLKFHPNFVFRDDEDLPFGEKIGENLISAIKHSKVSIPVISKNYAASEWCLRELIQIMECKKTTGQIVLPVFYNVKPYEVRELQGAFGEAFKSRQDRFKKEEVKQKGPVALRELVDSRVYESEKITNGREGELVKELVQVIMDKWQQDFLPPVPGNLVGIDDRVAEVMEFADTDFSGTRIIVICGIGGIGKTTLATTIYNKLSAKFKYCSLLMDIRETINRKGMDHVQSLIISDITKNHKSGVRDSMTGSRKIQLGGKNKKVLILLDDVGHRDHLDHLINGCNFKSGSIIIITCRDKAIITSGVKAILKFEYRFYELRELKSKDSMLLFSSYAFEPKQPRAELGTVPKDIVATTGGLPLALKIIGSLLKGKHKSIWTETLQKLRKVPDTDVQQKLRISYDSLEYEQQQMFLDIACFFIGSEKKIVTYRWKDLQYFPDSGLERMIELSLMEIDDNDKFKMHDQLRDFGRAIACPANKNPWKCSRLWDEKAIIVQHSKEENRYIEALRLDENGSNMFMNRRRFERMPYLKFLHLSKVDYVGNFEGSLSELRWLKWEKFRDSFSVIDIHLENLLILDLSYGYISDEWRGWSSIEMERLKVLNLSHCHDLERTPDLSRCKSLEILILEDCVNLEEIDPSIGDAKCLTSLNLSGCRKLEELPSQLGELKCLVSLNLSACLTLENLPEEMDELEDSLTKLEILNAKFCESLVGLPDSISHLVNLSTLDLRWCKQFKELPESIGSLVKLQCLLLGNMPLSSELDDWVDEDVYPFNHIPHSIGELGLLIELHLTCANISKLPESIGDLKILKILKIAGCKELSSLPSTINELGKLEELDATACKKMEGRVLINGLFSLKILRLGKLLHTVDLLALHEMGNLSLEMFEISSSQRHLDLIDFPANLTVLEVTCQNHELCELSHLIHLKELTFQFCEFLKSIPVLPSGIFNLCIIFCGKLEKLSSLSSLESLSKLHIIGCGELMEIKGLEGLKSLGRLFLCGCKKLPNLNGLEHLESLRELKIEDLNASLMNDPLFQVLCLGGLKNLEVLSITHCQTLTRQALTRLDISQLTHLRELKVSNCANVVKIKGLKVLKKLTYLDIQGCNSITKLHIIGCGELMEIKGLEELNSLGRLFLCGCKKLPNLNGLEHLESLRELKIEDLNASLMNDSLLQVLCLGGLKNLEVLSITRCQTLTGLDISQLTHLRKLEVSECEDVVEIEGLKGLKKLTYLDIRGCNSMTKLHIIGCGELMEIKGLEGLKSLGRLFLCECKKLPNLNGLEHLESLRELKIEDLNASLMNDSLLQVLCLGGLKNLEVLSITRCQTLTRLDISQLTDLRELVVSNCANVVKIKGLKVLKKLTYLDIRGCNSIRNLPDLSLFDNLRQLDIRGCSNLQYVQGPERRFTVLR